MKKLLQILGITTGALIGLVVVTVAMTIWFIFTPERLTPVVRNVADEYITCEWDMGDVDLTFFSTFPEFGLHIDGLYLVNPMKGAQSDTVLVAPSVVARLDVMAYLQHHNLIIQEISLPDVTANVYINASGENNLTVFKTSPDTTSSDSAFTLPFDTLMVQGCSIRARRLTFVDAKDTINAYLGTTQLDLTVATLEDVHLQLKSRDVNVQMKGETYANHLALELDLPTCMDLNRMFFRLKGGQLTINQWRMMLDGDVIIGDSIAMNARVGIRNWRIASVMGLLPATIKDSLSDLNVDGLLTLDATARGIYAENSMPVVNAHVQIIDGCGQYAELPYTLSNVLLDAKAHVDMNRPKLSHVIVQKMSATTQQTTVEMTGSVQDFMGEQLTHAHLSLDANLPDWSRWLPQPMVAQGRLQGEIDIDAYLADLSAQRMDRIVTAGNIHLSGLNIQTDSMQAELSDGQLHFDAALDEWPLIKAHVSLQSSQMLTYRADSINARMLAPNVQAYAAYDIKDTTLIPTFDANIQFTDLVGQYATYAAHMGATQIEAKMTSSRRSQSVPVFSANLSSCNLNAQTDAHHMTVNNIVLEAKARYRKEGTNLLLQWNPMLKFALNGAEADLDGFEEHISVPQILFSYNNRDFDILSSSVLLGKSDFSLTGSIHHIGKWLMKQDDLTGELNFTSNHTDVNELMNLFSADAGSEETTSSQTADADKSQKSDAAEPFLVPNNVDLTLNTHIGEAEIFDQVAKNLKGKLYIKDGTLVLEEMGFVCDAAKLQLTAMYRTPRRDHIYVGLDYHMLDVKIDQLISMIPQIDTMMPMLSSFSGDAEFHLAAETYLRSNYQIKTSTLRGACSLFGKDLVVMDSETFNKIRKLLLFKKKTQNIVDSISAEITLYKDQIDVYPFSVSMDNYMLALGGKHKLNKTYNYHVNLLSPFYIGADILGTEDKLKIKPARCIYAKDFKPIIHKNVDTQNAELRQLIRDSLRKNVKIQ